MKARYPASIEIVDRRIQRTREALREAMMELMVERGWDAIDVSALCDRANIGRSTFYQHYPNKEELLKANFVGLRDALLAQVPGEVSASGEFAFISGLIAHVHEAQEVFRALLNRRSGNYVQDRFRELLVEMMLVCLPGGKTRNWQSTARAHYLGGALFELLAWWLGNNRPQKPKDIEALFYLWSTPVLAPSA
jgi:AcrR family transcriptional regulator